MKLYFVSWGLMHWDGQNHTTQMMNGSVTLNRDPSDFADVEAITLKVGDMLRKAGHTVTNSDIVILGFHFLREL